MNTGEWPWERTCNPNTITPDDKNYMENYELKQPKFFSISDEARHLDGSARRAAINAAQSVVSLVTYSDHKEIFQGTGTIIKENGTILTSAKLFTCPTRENVVAENLKVIVYLWDENSYEADVLAYDLYYGIAVVKIRGEDVPKLKPACLRRVDDSISLEVPAHDDKGFQLRPHSNAYRLVPGDKVIALGRYFIKPYSLMAAPGEFRQVPRRPLLGMKMANLYTADLEILSELNKKFPNYFVGVIVEEVIQGSSADTAGICPNDLLVECCGRPVRGFLELFDMMWDKTGDSVDLVVLRASDGATLSPKVDILNATTQNKKRKKSKKHKKSKKQEE